MLQCDEPADFVIGTGKAHSVREFLDEAFGYVNRDWHDYVKIDPRYFRPNEMDFLLSDPSKARRVIGWEPRVCFRELVHIMVDADMELLGLHSPGEGRKIMPSRPSGETLLPLAPLGRKGYFDGLSWIPKPPHLRGMVMLPLRQAPWPSQPPVTKSGAGKTSLLSRKKGREGGALPSLGVSPLPC